MMQQDKLVNRQKNSRKQTFITTIILFIAVCASCPGLFAGSKNTTVQVSATVASACVMQGETLNFGTYDPTIANDTAALNATGSLSIKCTHNTTAVIGIDQGQYASAANGTSRAMRSNNGTSYLSYDLYLDAGRSTVWNNVNKAEYTASGSVTPTILSIYGSVPSSQDASDGQYNDVVTVTANF